MADFVERQRACPMKPHCREVGARRDRYAAQFSGVADPHTAEPFGVQWAVSRALDRGFERRIDVGVSFRQNSWCYKAVFFRYKANTSRSKSVD